MRFISWKTISPICMRPGWTNFVVAEFILNIFFLAFKHKNYTKIYSCFWNSLWVDSSSILVGWALPHRIQLIEAVNGGQCPPYEKKIYNVGVNASFGRLGRAWSYMLGFVPLPNLRKLCIYRNIISKGETQQIPKANSNDSLGWALPAFKRGNQRCLVGTAHPAIRNFSKVRF